jgi:asparagine synthase (glutamine-hydrolysing)
LSAYWSLAGAAEAGWADPFLGDEAEAAGELERLLKDAIRGQMIADVPLGAFLSGGIDSSTVVALMQAQSARPVCTFSIGFDEASYDEAPQARTVARHLGTEHTELYVTSAQAQALIPRLAAIWDEPFADSSQIPTFLVSELARQHVTVSLSGDGGDELFAGYGRYFEALGREALLRRVPALGLRLLKPLPRQAYGLAARAAEAAGVMPEHNPIRALRWASQTAGMAPEDSYREQSFTHWPEPERLVLGAHEPATVLSGRAAWPPRAGLVDRLSYLDLAFYLPEDILVKLDRASMAVGLEARVPLLDHRVVEFARRVPIEMKTRNGRGKWLLRQVLQRYVPAALFERPKMGFAAPLGAWLRGDLREWAKALLDPQRLEQDGLFDVAALRRTWKAQLSGRRAGDQALWDLLMFQQWRETALP